MTTWSDGLPPAAHARAARQRESGVAGSLLSAPGAAAIASVALQPVGEVFGSLVVQLGWTGGGCGIWAMASPLGYNYGFGGATGPGGSGFGSGILGGWTTPVLTTGGSGGRNAGFGSYVQAFAQAWHGAHDRMLAEAGLLAADGVVGVQVRRRRLEGQIWEFTATGTAVRTLDTSISPRAGAPGPRTGASGHRAGGPWTAGFSAEHTTALLQSGYVPRGMALGLSVSTKHEDALLKQQRSTWSGNTEVDGLTHLLEAARDDARQQLTNRAGRLGASDLVVTDSSVGEFETSCGDESDLHAEALFIGTAIAPGPMHAFRGRSAQSTARRGVTSVIPLTDPGVRSAARHR
ncbi:heavy metal-binding domain-containing protein [Curtobacterium sp. MCBA15_001]|uniref:heavy metal-binding domain-containing protein n=1 Tax=Curtobacterium sp. MCBA15_001 TaxID=1898731 RepID=UPI000B319AB8|nr:heavy metal-binding domain-containing protein [Curtobacterium sp. MCBA15_001]